MDIFRGFYDFSLHILTAKAPTTGVIILGGRLTFDSKALCVGLFWKAFLALVDWTFWAIWAITEKTG